VKNWFLIRKVKSLNLFYSSWKSWKHFTGNWWRTSFFADSFKSTEWLFFPSVFGQNKQWKILLCMLCTVIFVIEVILHQKLIWRDVFTGQIEKHFNAGMQTGRQTLAVGFHTSADTTGLSLAAQGAAMSVLIKTFWFTYCKEQLQHKLRSKGTTTCAS